MQRTKACRVLIMGCDVRGARVRAREVRRLVFFTTGIFTWRTTVAAKMVAVCRFFAWRGVFFCAEWRGLLEPDPDELRAAAKLKKFESL